MAAVLKISQVRARRDIERAAALSAMIREAQAELDAIKEEFRSQGPGEYLGSEHKIVVSTSTTTRLDLAEVKARLSPADYLSCTVLQDTTRVLIKEV